MVQTRFNGKRVPKAQPAPQPPPPPKPKGVQKVKTTNKASDSNNKTSQKTKAATKASSSNTKTAQNPKAAKKAPATKITTGKTAQKTQPAPKASASKGGKPKKPRAEASTTASKKRKATDDAPAQPNTKQARVTKPAKAPKPKVVINHAPTQKLNVYVFGEGSAGELGLGTAKNVIDVKRPRLNPLLSAKDVGVVQIACGGMHVAALTHDNKILTWGVNDQGALGRNTEWSGGLRDADKEDSDSDDEDSGLNPHEATPTAVSGFPSNTIFTGVAAADSATFAITDEGKVWGWGTFRSGDGVLGFKGSGDVQRTPVLIERLNNITRITCGSNHCLALNNKGQIFVWGNGEQNELGYRLVDRHKNLTVNPKPLRMGRKRFQCVGTGANHSFAIDEQDRVWSWGSNSMGETGHEEGAGGSAARIYVPAEVEGLRRPNDPVTFVTGGTHHSVALTRSGSVLVWGGVEAHQLGLDMSTVPEADCVLDERGNKGVVIVPTAIAQLQGAKWAAAGPDHNIIINSNNEPVSWGFSENYQTGQGTTDDIVPPTTIANTAVRGKKLTWSGAGGQYSILAGPAEDEVMVDNVDASVDASFATAVDASAGPTVNADVNADAGPSAAASVDAVAP
ncbi:MAG: hypothetical protein Q9191_006527 [Dirinaria sp. TL-2023a]